MSYEAGRNEHSTEDLVRKLLRADQLAAAGKTNDEIAAERLIADRGGSFAVAGGPPMVLHVDNGPEMISQVPQQFFDSKVGVSRSAGTNWSGRSQSSGL